MLLVDGMLFIVTGGVILATAGTLPGSGTATTLYAFINFVGTFSLGPLTFMLPAELFPTKFRASSHGLSAAAGKGGTLLVFLGYTAFGPNSSRVTASNSPLRWLSYMLLSLAGPLFLGAFVVWWWIPNLQHASGKSKTLEELAEGRKANASRSVISTENPA